MGFKVHATAVFIYSLLCFRAGPSTHSVGGWMGPRTGLDGCGKSRLHRDSITWPSSP